MEGRDAEKGTPKCCFKNFVLEKREKGNSHEPHNPSHIHEQSLYCLLFFLWPNSQQSCYRSKSFVRLTSMVWTQSKQVRVQAAIFSKTWNTLRPCKSHIQIHLLFVKPYCVSKASLHSSSCILYYLIQNHGFSQKLCF